MIVGVALGVTVSVTLSVTVGVSLSAIVGVALSVFVGVALAVIVGVYFDGQWIGTREPVVWNAVIAASSTP